MGQEALSEGTREFLRALSSSTRQQILMLFIDGRARSVGQIAAEAGIAQSTASQQLSILQRGGLVVAEREGKVVRYLPDPVGFGAAMAELQQLMSQCCPPLDLS